MACYILNPMMVFYFMMESWGLTGGRLYHNDAQDIFILDSNATIQRGPSSKFSLIEICQYRHFKFKYLFPVCFFSQYPGNLATSRMVSTNCVLYR